MALILSIETSGERCSVAVHNDDVLLASAYEAQPRAHAAKLAPLLEQVLKNAGISASQLNAVAISAGPGSYTGLRIGTSTAKGICYTLGIPLLAVNTLDLLIAQLKQEQKAGAQLLCPMIDARRMEVYCKIVDRENHLIQEMKPVVVDEFTFTTLLNNQTIHFFGDGAKKCRMVIQHKNALFSDNIFPVAETLGILAFHKLGKNITEDLLNFEPVYLKEFLIKSPRKAIIQ
ncbi:MAG: tRNA (adenosine(37)-N6)-threonylcarbamoyltransferase complex dimerization subunit type 1 TsaB [Flammeovirgaceae bacterium]|nr:MAG: tRNA (adenosine(37)-N6)-threonylcarbamoyltransferase complex dimerization subunit type 1 TsaB [Flammeovirgaceae bacterium]